MNGSAPEANGASGPVAIEPRRTGGWRGPLFVALTLAGWSACLLANWPGHFSVDSVSQLAQGRTGLYDDWHPPLMAWLLGLADRAVRGAPIFFAADAALACAALLVFSRASPGPRIQGMVVMALALASPQMLIFQGVAWKDLLFADATLAAFAALALAGRAWDRRPARAGLLLGAFALFLVATLTRQTGFAAPLAGAAVLAALCATRGGTAPMTRRRWIGGGLAALAGLAALFACAALIGQAFAARNDGKPGSEFQLRLLQVYDLAGALKLDPRLPLVALRRDQPALEQFERAQAAPNYKASTIDYLDDLPGADDLLPPASPAVSADWGRLILRHPLLWLSVRAGVFLATLQSNPDRGCPLISTGIWTDDADDLAISGLSLRREARDEWDEDYVNRFVGTPFLSHLAWGIVAFGLLALAGRDLARGDRRPEVMAIAGLLAAALAFCASFLVISVACDYRYLIVLDLAAMAAAVQRASSPGLAARTA
jgi:hypothetical protein